jgi:transcriptional regulator with XRE-family HTH domain
MSMTALERKALFKAAVTLREITMAEAAALLGVSYNHLILVLRGDRVGSAQLVGGIAEFVGREVRELFSGPPQGMAERVQVRVQAQHEVAMNDESESSTERQ